MPAPDTSLPQAVEHYFRNRTNFYAALLARVPEPSLRERLRGIASRFETSDDLLEQVKNLTNEVDADLLSALKLRDLLKKPNFGTAYGRTAISADDAVSRAQHVEETGVLLFTLLTDQFGDEYAWFALELANCKRALTKLIQLDDDLRYHRVRFTQGTA